MDNFPKYLLYLFESHKLIFKPSRVVGADNMKYLVARPELDDMATISNFTPSDRYGVFSSENP